MTGLAKVDGICDYLSDLLENDIKIIVFAHHYAVLDRLEEHLVKEKITYIRIDGKIGKD